MEGPGVALAMSRRSSSSILCDITHHLCPSGREKKAVFSRPNSAILSRLTPLRGYQTLASLTIFPEPST